MKKAHPPSERPIIATRSPVPWRTCGLAALRKGCVSLSVGVVDLHPPQASLRQGRQGLAGAPPERPHAAVQTWTVWEGLSRVLGLVLSSSKVEKGSNLVLLGAWRSPKPRLSANFTQEVGLR